jgi:hypothetical protein
MKVKYYESVKKSAKLYHQTERSTNFTNGLIHYHDFDEDTSSNLTWWEDVEFILNDYRVNVACIHPRLDYLDSIKTEAHNKIDHLYPVPTDIFEEPKQNYVKDRKSKFKSVPLNTDFTKEFNDWSAAYNSTQQELLLTSEYKAKPFITSEWLAYCRYIDICAPIEIRGSNDLVKLVDLVKRLLKGETTIENEFPAYTYAKVQWEDEGLNKKTNPTL